MDVMRSPSQPAPTGLGLSMPSPQQDVSQPAATLSPARKAAREAKRRRASPPKVGTLGGKESATPTTLSGTKWTGKTRFASSATSKPLLPVTERKSQEEKNTSRRARGRGSDDKVDIAPDGGSAGRDGRQFTVANVGNNGRIYLRPSVRPAHQRYPQPNFVFPMTPPGTAGLDTLAGKSQFDDVVEPMTTTNSLWTPSPSTPGTVRKQYFQIHSRRPTGHRRALSDSTIRDDSDVGAFKVVISKPGEDLNRPKTTEDIDASGGPLLDIDIPTWKIGNPRFTMKGTPFFRGSSYAPTEEMSRSSNVSFLRSQRGDLAPHSGETSSLRKPNPISIPQIRYPAVDAMRSPPITSARLPAPYPTGAVTAATPPRLVAEITSPTFLDYELISDFFLTYRAFLEPSDLLRMIVARLRWALGRDDEVGMVVRVRTFVAIRHWILNYFMDDFVIDYGLRVSFCNLLNDFVEELSQDARARKVQLKILAELKKCWRRVCAQYWDGPEFDSSLDPDEPIAPGGIAGHRNASLDPSFWENADLPPRLSGLFSAVKQTAGDERSFYADVSRAGHIGDSHILGPRPSTPENQIAQEFEPQQTSPKSMASLDVVSCSFPGKIGRAVHPGSSNPMAVHPVPPSSVYTNAAAVATTPRALTGKRVRPSANHKRNGSLTDSLRERSHSTDKLGLNQDTEHLLSFPYAGSLVRGNLLPPGQPFVEILPPNMSSEQRETTIFQQSPLGPEKSMASAMSGPGMKRLICSVRRALSTRGQGVSPTQGNFINISPIGPRGATTNRLPGTAIVPQARPHQNGVRPPVRIDLLGAEIAEDFKKAVREDAAAEAEQRDLALRLPADHPLHSAIPDEMLEYSAAHIETLLGSPSMANPIIDDHLRPMSDTCITTGSKSIVISIRSSYLRSPEQDSSAFVDVASSQFSPEHVNTFSLGVMAEQPPKRDLSLFSTHSSKPVMRPSFEAEAQKLAQIPDDANDDGGVESALAKLEGKYEKKQFKLSMEPTNTPKTIPAHLDGAFGGSDMIEKQGPRHLHLGDGEGSATAPHYVDDLSSQSGPITLHVPRRRAHTDAKSFLSDKSGASYSSIPLLERGLTDDGRSKTGTEEWRGRSILVDPGEASPATTPRPSPLCDSQHPSYEFVEKTRSMDGVQSENARHSPSEDQSYLDLESEDDGTDLSSEMSLEVINSDDFDGEGSFPPMDRSTSVIKRMPTHPLADSGSERESQLPSPPMTLAQALRMSPETATVPQLHEHQLWSSKPLPLPPTPDTTPTAAQYPKDARNASDDVASHADASVASDRFSRKFSIHLPFILAFDSEILAQQFTLIEKDALNEIDWKELIEMGWKNATNNDSRSWVDFLRNTDAHGVEVVIARFNIMVKWACSEIPIATASATLRP
ncbi:Guanine nucleotide exchange factor LTE1 like protein [Verticillium longisporum]|nr:Guanine nucleotide exchange factor LTE1 like protein [Verticillium longisporum]